MTFPNTQIGKDVEELFDKTQEQWNKLELEVKVIEKIPEAPSAQGRDDG